MLRWIQNSFSAQPLNFSTSQHKKKPGGKTKFSSRVEVWGCDSERFSKPLIKRRASMPLSFLRFSFCCFLSFLSHRLLIPPFQSAFAEICEELGMTSLNDEIHRPFFFVKRFSQTFSNSFISSRATFFFDAREIFFFWPSRK